MVRVCMNIYIKHPHRHTHIYLEIMTGEHYHQSLKKKKNRSIFSSRLLLLRTKFLIPTLYVYVALIYQSKGERNVRTQNKDLAYIL